MNYVVAPALGRVGCKYGDHGLWAVGKGNFDEMIDEFGALSKQWIDIQLGRQGIGHETARLYRLFLADFEEHIGARTPIGDIQPIHVETWAAGVRKDGQPYKANSRNTRMKPIRGFFEWAVKSRLIDRSPAEDIGQARVGRHLAKGLSRAEVERLLWVADIRDRTIILAGLHLGLRREEIAGMQVTNWDRSDGMFFVVGKNDKERAVPVSEEMGQAMQTWVDLGLGGRRVGPFWPSTRNRAGVLKKDHVARIVKIRAAEAQVEATTHTLRHTCGVDLSDAGVPPAAIQAWLGHESLRTTGIYMVPRHLQAYANLRHYLPDGLKAPGLLDDAA